jgi:hypothetical protein
MTLMRRLNPTASILKAHRFCADNDYLFALLCLLNVNMGALDLSRTKSQDSSVVDAYHAHSLLHELATVYSRLRKEAQTRVYKRVLTAGAVPVSRDTPSYVAVMSVLHGEVPAPFPLDVWWWSPPCRLIHVLCLHFI